jgi:hypothetical protein
VRLDAGLGSLKRVCTSSELGIGRWCCRTRHNAHTTVVAGEVAEWGSCKLGLGISIYTLHADGLRWADLG